MEHKDISKIIIIACIIAGYIFAINIHNPIDNWDKEMMIWVDSAIWMSLYFGYLGVNNNLGKLIMMPIIAFAFVRCQFNILLLFYEDGPLLALISIQVSLAIIFRFGVQWWYFTKEYLPKVPKIDWEFISLYWMEVKDHAKRKFVKSK